MRTRGKRLQDGRCGCRAGGKCEGIARVFQRCNGLLEVCAVGVGGPGVFVIANWVADGALSKSGREGYLREVLGINLVSLPGYGV